MLAYCEHKGAVLYKQKDGWFHRMITWQAVMRANGHLCGKLVCAAVGHDVIVAISNDALDYNESRDDIWALLHLVGYIDVI